MDMRAPLILTSEPTPFPGFSVASDGRQRVTLQAQVPFVLQRIILPRCHFGLVWCDWFVGRTSFMSANQPFPRGSGLDSPGGVALDRGVELDVSAAYVTVKGSKLDEAYGGLALREEVRSAGVLIGIAEEWGLEFYNPTAAAIIYEGACALIKRVL